MSLALREGNLPSLEIDPQRISSCASSRAALPGPGAHWAAGSVVIVGLVLEIAQMNFEEGSLYDLSGAFTYAATLMPASCEALKHCAKTFRLTKRPRVVHNRLDDEQANSRSHNYWINALLEIQSLDLEAHLPHSMLNCRLTLAGALNKMARMLRIGHFEDDLDSSISVIALHLTSDTLDFRFKSDTGAGGLRCWRNQSFMPSTTSSLVQSFRQFRD